MKFFFKAKDGGPLSRVTGYWLCEGKKSFSLALLRFDDGTRDVFHSHAFNSLSLVLGPGYLREQHLDGPEEVHGSLAVVRTLRETFHQVRSVGTTWVLTVRGPWTESWLESDRGEVYSLRNGRVRYDA